MTLTAVTRWKEELYIYDEQGHQFMFDCGWGGPEMIAYVPSAERWLLTVPQWLHARRDEVIQAMVSANHRVEEGWYNDLAPDTHDSNFPAR